jgi:hypothetical protein
MFLSGCANGGWTTADTYRQAGMLSLTMIDWAQTRKIAQNPDKYYENNPVLGKHPSTERVDMYFPICMAAHTAVAMALPTKYRKWWQYVFIGVEAGMVANNLSIGLGMGF